MSTLSHTIYYTCFFPGQLLLGFFRLLYIKLTNVLALSEPKSNMSISFGITMCMYITLLLQLGVL